MNQKIITVPGWIYRLEDYVQMFDLSDKDLSKKILDYPGATSSFNAEMNVMGHKVLSGDEFYSLDATEIQQYVKKYFQDNEDFLREHVDCLKEKTEAGINEVLEMWRSSIHKFLSDYESGKKQGRYQAISLPFPFDDHEFELALCHDLLFHSQIKNELNQQDLISELCRVAHEVRIFPLHDEFGGLTEDLGPLLMILQQNNFGVEVRQVSYKFKKGGNAMLRIWAKECVVEE